MIYIYILSTVDDIFCSLMVQVPGSISRHEPVRTVVLGNAFVAKVRRHGRWPTWAPYPPHPPRRSSMALVVACLKRIFCMF